MLPKKELKLVHFQLTRDCNLRCWFCGQWGRKGFFSNMSGETMSIDDWKKVVSELKKYRELSGISPKVILWGGEPLMFAEFDEITEHLSKNEFQLGMVTNGVLIDRHVEIIKKHIKRIYVSIDGPRNIHDSIRGKGVFDKVIKNLKLLKDGDSEITIMTVISKPLLLELEGFLKGFSDLNLTEILLQEMIYLSAKEIESYRIWLEKCFEQQPAEIFSWQMEIDEYFLKEKEEAINRILKNNAGVRIRYIPHGVAIEKSFCISPFKHAHIAWNGNVLYCTDFYDFSAGNVKNESLEAIFNNSLSEKFRKEIQLGNCATCNHCSWRENTEFEL